jgi:hypothetical protein
MIKKRGRTTVIFLCDFDKLVFRESEFASLVSRESEQAAGPR